MKTKLLVLGVIVTVVWIFNSGFSTNDEDPKWSNHPSTRMDINPVGKYTALPEGDNRNFSNETRYISTPQGVFAVGPNFRVVPSLITQSETPITRHPTNSKIMFASANTYNNGVGAGFSTGHYVTTDGGVSWFGDDVTVTSFGDPAPMVMHTNRLIISFITTTGSMGSSYSTDLGTTWSGTYTFPGASNSADKNLSAVDGIPTSAYYGRLYTVYTEFAGAYAGRIVATYSDNGGVTWSAVQPVSPVPSAGHHHQGCDVTVDIFGWVRVVYANCTSNGQNSTEDYLGWAESGNGGVTWGDMSDTKVNTNGIRSADLLPSPPAGVIRMNGFPRIDGDKTCLSTSGDEYVVMAEKNFAPALDNADIVLNKTGDGGSSWTRVRVNQNASGSYEYSPAVNVDATGAINVCYYSTRNSPANDSAEIYLSRSTDGGVTFTDVKISDHKFKPLPIPGTAGGYQGDYIGITSGGNGKILPYWCEQNTSTGGRYQAYTALVDITQPRPCEDFSCALDTGTATTGVITQNFYEEYSGSNFWNRRSAVSAYGSGTGSARFNSWSASVGTTQSLTSYNFSPIVIGNDVYFTFDEAYRPWTGGNVDSLIVESSVNSGSTWSVRARLWGGLGAQAGPLNTVFIGGGQFTPSSREWRSKIYKLPIFTNKVRIRAVSGFGNDIWVDNLCVQTLPDAVPNSIGLLNQGMFIPNFPYWTFPDTVDVHLFRVDFPNIAVDSATSVVANNAIVDDLFFNKAFNGNYYRVVRHRNALETWSNTGVSYTRGAASHHNFVPDGASYGNNMAIVSTTPFYRAQYSGDCNQDDFIDIADLTIIDNSAFNFGSGYIVADLNGDFFADISDYAIADNNANNFVGIEKPPGAEPLPPTEDINTVPVLETEQDRIKWELHKQVMSQKGNTFEVENKVMPELNDVLKERDLRAKDNKAPLRKLENTQYNTKDEGNTNSNNGKRVGEK